LGHKRQALTEMDRSEFGGNKSLIDPSVLNDKSSRSDPKPWFGDGRGRPTCALVGLRASPFQLVAGVAFQAKKGPRGLHLGKGGTHWGAREEIKKGSFWGPPRWFGRLKNALRGFSPQGGPLGAKLDRGRGTPVFVRRRSP